MMARSLKMSVNRTGSLRHYAFLLFLLLVPLSVASLWGPYFQDLAYSLLRYAQNLAAGRGIGFDASLVGTDLPQSLLVTGLFALFESLVPLSQISLFLSALGWGVAAITIYLTLRPKNSTVATLAAVLLVFSPIVTHTLASPVSWVVALGWLAIALAIRDQDGRLVVVVMLTLLVMWFDLSVLFLIGLLLLWRWRNGRPMPKVGLLLILALTLLWAGFATIQFGRPIDIFPFARLQETFQPLQRSELAWLFLPFILFGLWVGVIGQYVPTIGLTKDPEIQLDPELSLIASFIVLWALSASLIGSALAPALVTVAALYLVALGLAWGQKWLAGRRSPSAAHNLTLAIVGLLLLIQLTVTWRNYIARPVSQYELEDQVAEWLQSNSGPGAILYASRRVGYLADRPTSPADPQTREPGQLVTFFNSLSNSLPEYFVTGSNMEWLALAGSGWLDSRYDPVARFASDYAPQDTLTVWAYQKSLFDEGERQPANVAVGDNLELVAYQYEPTDIRPGDDIYLTLYLKATRPITVGMSTDVHLRYMRDGHVWAWEQHGTPGAVSGQFWQPGQILAERIKLRTEDNIPFGAYELQVFWRWPDRDERWLLYQENDANPLDRLNLGYVIAPPPVDAGQMLPVGAKFGDQIQLSGLNVSQGVKPGDEMALSLYWEALRVPDNRYTVFVHLFNDEGELVASHDGEPVDGTYPTAAWQPGHMVQDTHHLSLPADLAPGVYDLRVGLYLLETGQRLPVSGAGGEVYPDHSLPLASLEIGD